MNKEQFEFLYRNHEPASGRTEQNDQHKPGRQIQRQGKRRRIRRRLGRLVHGVNSLWMPAAPIGIMAENINMIGRGEILLSLPIHITEIDEIKQNINNCITGLDGLVEGKDILQRMSSNDYTGIAKSGYSGIFAEIADSINGVADRINRTIDVLKNITIGDFKDLEYLKSIGKRSENDMLMPSMIKMIEIIKTLVEETTLLSDSPVDGKRTPAGVPENSRRYAKVIGGS